VYLRLLRRDERELVAGCFAGLSAEFRSRRFLQPLPQLPQAMLRRLVDVDSRRQVDVPPYAARCRFVRRLSVQRGRKGKEVTLLATLNV
jgi:hypothetical protein